MTPPPPNPDDAISEIIDFILNIPHDVIQGMPPPEFVKDLDEEIKELHQKAIAEAHRRLSALMVEGQIAELQALLKQWEADKLDTRYDIGKTAGLVHNRIAELQQQLKKENGSV